MFNDSQNSKALHEVINEVLWNCHLQTQGIDVGIPFICGAPGGGKTASIHYLSKEYGFGVVSTHIALKPIEETGGIPQFDTIMINGKPVLGTIWSFPDIMKTLYDMSELKKDSIVVWLLDDAHLLSPIHMGLLYELFTERSLRGYQIPKNCAMVMAGNTSSKSGAKSMFSAIINRCVLMPVYTDFNGWKNNFALKEETRVHPAFVSFLGHQQYQKFFHEEEQVDIAWGSPRSWTRFANEVKLREEFHKKIISTDVCLYLGTGYVGKEGASEFTTYYKIYSEFDIDNILANYKEYNLPPDNVKMYALAYALTTNYIGRSDRDKFLPNISHLIGLFMKEASELSIMMIKEIRQFEKISNKKNILNKIIMQLQKTEPDLTRSTLKEIVDITSDSGE
ncbi:MAG TPA: hypothetical protein PLL26_06585 [Candidatus Dojkabacteria bacterium]|nr:hypothetical protein [Candidatus Dojkabacteria bacterium]